MVEAGGSDGYAAISERMARALDAMDRDFRRIRTGRASASLVDRLLIDQRGTRSPIGELASITVPDARLIVIEPWDRGALRAIGKAISQSGIGVSPTIEGSVIRLHIPPLTEDRRHELAGLIRQRAERARVEIRQVRHEALGAIREKDSAAVAGADEIHRDLEGLERLTVRFIAEVDRRAYAKEAELLDTG